MRKRKKMRTVRISATLPQEMAEDFKAKSEMSGISISRLIFLRLRTRKPILIVGRDLLAHVRELRQVLDKIVDQGTIDVETVGILRQQVRFYETFIDTGSGVYVHVP